jgi:DNA-directed RNA polymerase specialized sigma24 family protein
MAKGPPEGLTDDGSFEEFFRRNEAGVRYALVASLGFEVGREACAEAFAYAWENWPRVRAMDNAAGYVFRMGQRRGRRVRHTLPLHDTDVPTTEPLSVEPGLANAIVELPKRQRQSVLLVHGAGWSIRQAAALLGVSPPTVQTHLARGLESLRRSMGVEDV